jgi:hypothetical protein
MSDLQIAPPREGNNTIPILIAVAVLAAIAAAIFYFNPHKVADLKVTKVDTFAPHTTFEAMEGPSAPGTHVIGAPTSSAEDDLYVIASTTITDHLRLPLFITGVVVNVTMADGSQLEENMLSAGDLKRLEVLFPAITQKAGNPIQDGDEVAPGQTVTGSVVIQLSGKTLAEWNSKKAATLTVQLRNQEPQTTRLP